MNAFLADKGLDFLIGILGGFSVVAIGWFFTARLAPFIRRLTNDDVDVGGNWWGRETTAVGEYTYHLSLSPRFYHWLGSATITRSATAPGIDDYRHDFKITALRRGPYVIVNLLGSKDHAGSLATGLFLLEQRGIRMSGAWAYRPSGSEVPESEKISFKRM